MYRQDLLQKQDLFSSLYLFDSFKCDFRDQLCLLLLSMAQDGQIDSSLEKAEKAP